MTRWWKWSVAGLALGLVAGAPQRLLAQQMDHTGPGKMAMDTSHMAAMKAHMDSMDAMDARMDSLVRKMNASTGSRRTEAMAAVIREMAAAQHAMHQHMREAMRGMMQGSDSGMSCGAPGASCPMNHMGGEHNHGQMGGMPGPQRTMPCDSMGARGQHRP